MEQKLLQKLGINLIYTIKEPVRFNLDAKWAQEAGYFDPTTDAWLDTLYIPQEIRKGNHFGTQVLNDLEMECRNKGVRRICTCFFPADDESDLEYTTEDFYKNKGFLFVQLHKELIIAYKDLI